MKHSKLFAVTTAVALLAGGFVTFNSTAAQKDTAPRRHLGGRLAERAKEKLGLTDEQVARIKAVLKADKDTLTGLLTRMHDARAEMRQSIRSAEATEAAVRSAAAKVAAVEADLAVERMKLFRQISPILTAEQREKLNAMQSQLDTFIERALSRAGEKAGE